METKIKKIGTSKGIILSKEFLEIRGYEVGDIINISDIYKVNKNKLMSDEE